MNWQKSDTDKTLSKLLRKLSFVSLFSNLISVPPLALESQSQVLALESQGQLEKVAKVLLVESL